MADSREYVSFPDDKGGINISEDVIAVIAANAVLEIDGVHSLYTAHGKELTDLVSKKSLARGIRIGIEENEITVDVGIMVKAGAVVNEVGREVQDAVVTAIESTTAVKVNSVNVSICGIAFKRP